MSWLVFAFCGPVLWAISVHLDKYLVDRYFKQSSAAVLLVFTAWVGVLLLPFIAIYQPASLELPPASIAVMTLSGVLYMGAMLFYLQALQEEEASVVAPFFQTSPVFAYALAYIVLGETLSGRQVLGGAMILVGAVLLSLRAGNGRKTTIKTSLVVKMLVCAFSLAVSSLIFKAFAVEEAFWPTTFWMLVGEAIFGAGLLAVPDYRRQFFTLVRTHTVPVLTVNFVNELINLGGGLGARYALMFAPLSIVQAIGSTTTLFVFIFGSLLSLVSPGIVREDLSARNLAQKGISAVLIVAGVTLATR
ncbi:MAG TPA: DMT family transporter [Alphaproteobacteria bacterium]